MDLIKEIWNSDLWLTIPFVGILVIILFGLIGHLIYNGIYDYFDWKKSTKETLSGELIDKRYLGEQYSPGNRIPFVSTINGGVTVGSISTSSYSDEEFLFFVRSDKVYKIEVDMQQFYDKNIGDKIKFEVVTGRFSKEELELNLLT